MSVPTPPSYRCSYCKSSPVDPRNLVVFIDGTSNKPGEKDTNVMKLYRQSSVSPGEGSSQSKQDSSYFKGIGASNSASLCDYFEMAFAWGVKKNVKDAYAWLAEEYRVGDQIYLFGFSRGAYQVRSLASMIHEVGLVTKKQYIDTAFFHFDAIDPYNDETRKGATCFKRDFCQRGVRVHFVGVWDTVSSLGFVKKKVHIATSASVTNACHFRHALALDERRVKFIPEYFTEVNAYHSKQSPRLDPEGNVKEVWFAGCHSDVGGTSWVKPPWNIHSEGGDPEFHPSHAGNVSLLWMRHEAAACGLAVKKQEFMWDPDDVTLGRRDTMTFPWSILEILPIYHQRSFFGARKHKRRLHLAQPRVVIPFQLIHSSILSSDTYTPLALLDDGINIPTIPRTSSTSMWTSEFQVKETTREILQTFIDGNEQKTLRFLENIIFLLDYGSLTGIQTHKMSPPSWAREIGEQTGFNIFALAVICFKISGPSSVSPEIVKKARDSFSTILRSDSGQYPRGALRVLRFSTRDLDLRRNFIAHDDVIKALVVSLERTAANGDHDSFPHVADSLCDLINGDSADTRRTVVDELLKRENDTVRSKLAIALEVKEPTHLMASLRMVMCLAQQPSCVLESSVEHRVASLAKTSRHPVGSVAARALMTLKPTCELQLYNSTALSKRQPEEGVYAIPFANILGLLCNILPRLDAEEDSGPLSDSDPGRDTPPVNSVGGIFRVLKFNSSGQHNAVMQKLVSSVKSDDTRQRTVATLTLLKLFACDSMLWSQELWRVTKGEVIATLTNQLRRKKTSLLAAYALYTCTRQNHITIKEIPPDAIKTMLMKDWFDGAIGRVEGTTLFKNLITLANGSQKIISNDDMVDILVDKLAVCISNFTNV